MPTDPVRRRDRRIVQGTAAVSAFLFLLGLGTWQMERLRWKMDLLDRMDRRAAAPPLPAPASTPDLPEYTPIYAEGAFRHDLEFLLVPRTRKGVAGAQVLTPLVRPDAPAILVNRGFVPAARTAVSTRRRGNPEGPVRVEGVLRPEPAPGPFVPDNDPAADAWYAIDLAAMAEDAGLELAPYVLEAGAAPNPGGWPAGAPAGAVLRNSHLGYALTWYGLAAVLAVCVCVLVRRADAPPPCSGRVGR